MRILRLIFQGLSMPCLMLGLLFFVMSLTPSLIPRSPVVQGVLGGVVTAFGYLLARIVLLLWQAADMPHPSSAIAKTLKIAFCLAVIGLFGWALISSLEWQNDLRTKMGIETADSLQIATIAVVATATFCVAFIAGALIAGLFRFVRARLYRWMPPRRANVIGVLLVAMALFVMTRDGLIDRLIINLDDSYEAAQNLFDRAPPRPENPLLTGGPGSLVDWAAMGEPGRNHVTEGPDAAAITTFTGRPALDPIRVYVGRANGETPQERADLALAELIRQGGFDREVLVVASPTGTGWLDPGAHDPLEYIHGGDIATVSAQYSYLISAWALIFETSAGLEQATALLETIHKYWKTLPSEDRPRLYVHGLSLGAWSSMYATNLFRLVDDPISGAFWAGPPFPSAFWNYVQHARAPGSPWVLPQIGDGSLVRYASHYADASHAEADWGSMRIVFLQNSSDPIVFYDPFALLRPPLWMTEPRAPDASEHMRFIPFVTQFQLGLDIALAFDTPLGHGHAYAPQDYIASWVQVTAPTRWSQQETERLKQFFSR